MISEDTLCCNHRTLIKKVGLYGKYMLLTVPTHNGNWPWQEQNFIATPTKKDPLASQLLHDIYSHHNVVTQIMKLYCHTLYFLKIKSFKNKICDWNTGWYFWILFLSTFQTLTNLLQAISFYRLVGETPSADYKLPRLQLLLYCYNKVKRWS